jgi:hypothetical protein
MAVGGSENEGDMNTEWITDVLRDLFRFAQMNRMNRLAHDLEQTLQGLEEERRAAARANLGPEVEKAESQTAEHGP